MYHGNLANILKLKKPRYVTRVVFFIFSSIFLTLLFSCEDYREKHSIDLTNRIDPDIVLVNIGDGNRESIAKLLLLINNCKPAVIGIDSWFIGKKDQQQDSALIKALDTIQNEVLAYYIDSTKKVVKSDSVFSSLSKNEGLVAVEEIDGLASAIKPIQMVNKVEHSLFALKIVEQWRPGFKTMLKINQVIPIKYTRTLDEFWNFDYWELLEVDCQILRNKIVLVGYLGPSNEDKHFTPIRIIKKYEAKDPDTYGLVIIANEIRTILLTEKK